MAFFCAFGKNALNDRHLYGGNMRAATLDNLAIELKCYALNFRNCRREKHMTQEQLSEKANVSAQYISKIEQGKCSPSLEISARLANALDVKLATILYIPDRKDFIYSMITDGKLH